MNDNNTPPNNERVARVMAICTDSQRGTETGPYPVMEQVSVASAGRYLVQLHRLCTGDAESSRLVVHDPGDPAVTELEVVRRVVRWRYWVEVAA